MFNNFQSRPAHLIIFDDNVDEIRLMKVGADILSLSLKFEWFRAHGLHGVSGYRVLVLRDL